MYYLNCHTYYSLRYGTFSEEELCALAANHGLKMLTITDINSTTAGLNFCRIAPKYGIRPLLGVDFRNGNETCYIALAQDNKAYKRLNDFLSEHLHQQKKFPKQAPKLPGCIFIYSFEEVEKQKKTNFRTDEYIGISMKSIHRLKFSTYRTYREKLVFQQPVSIRNKRDYNTHRLLRAIDLNILLSQLPQTEQADINDKMYSEKEVLQAFTDYDFILENTKNLMNSCHIDFQFGANLNKNLQAFSSSQTEDARILKKLIRQKLPQRYPQLNFKIIKRVVKEFRAVESLGFISYFLINLDIIEYAKSHDFPYIGRGSGANSILAYILGITNVDPIELNLYFERFINPNRISPPDFDLDFSWKDRNDITRYIFNKYPHTALMGTYVTFKRKATIRELGKIFGLPKVNIDSLSSGIFNFNQVDSLEKLVLKYSKYIEGFPNYRSVHSGGILILNEPVHQFSATFLPPKNFRTIQIDMHIAEEVGIHKFDILAQRGLPKIKDAIEIIRENQPEAELIPIDEVHRFKTDPKINSLLKQGNCMGVFYVESPAMRSLLIQLQTDNYLNLVAASSIIRPGVSGSGMKNEYIKRHRHPEKRKEAHPILNEIMPDTYGVMVYQEDVMKVAHYFAGLGLDDADVLRRGMSGKKTSKGQMEYLEKKFEENCLKKGYSPELIQEVWKQIASFAGYAFPKGHSASYAVESYQSLYLKCYFPLEFMVAVLNNGGGFYQAETYLREAENCGAIIELPDINKSDHATTIRGKRIYLGFGYLRELESNSIRMILENRNFFGEFKSLEDFLERVPISLTQVRILIRINAFRFTGLNKHALLWKALFFLNKSKTCLHQEKLFKTPVSTFEFPVFETDELIEAYDQIELLGFHLFHPFKMIETPFEPHFKVKDLKNHIGKTIVIYGDLITLKRTRTNQGDLMYFGTFYDEDFQIFDTVHFPKMAKNYPVYGKGVYKCVGKVMNEFGFLSLQLTKIYKMSVRPDPRYNSLSNSFDINRKNTQHSQNQNQPQQQMK